MITKKIIKNLIDNTVRGIEISALKDETNFIEFGLDSLDFSAVLMAVDEQLNIKIPDEAIEHCSSIKGLVDYCNKQALIT